MLSYAASYFGNADAQYDLARLYLKGVDASPRRFQLWRALAGAGGPEGPASGAGPARPDAVQRRPAAAAGRARPDVADAGARRRQRRTKPGSRKTTTGRSPRRPTTTARWRCRCSSTGCRAAGTDAEDGEQAKPKGWMRRGFAAPTILRAPRRLQIEIGPDRHVVGRLFPGAHIAVDPDIDQPVAGLRRQQQMVDAQAPGSSARRRPDNPRRCTGRARR